LQANYTTFSKIFQVVLDNLKYFLAPWRVLVLIQVGSLTLAESSTRHGTTKRKKENPKPSDAESSAKPLGRSSALTLGGFLDL